MVGGVTGCVTGCVVVVEGLGVKGVHPQLWMYGCVCGW